MTNIYINYASTDIKQQTQKVDTMTCSYHCKLAVDRCFLGSNDTTQKTFNDEWLKQAKKTKKIKTDKGYVVSKGVDLNNLQSNYRNAGYEAKSCLWTTIPVMLPYIVAKMQRGYVVQITYEGDSGPHTSLITGAAYTENCDKYKIFIMDPAKYTTSLGKSTLKTSYSIVAIRWPGMCASALPGGFSDLYRRSKNSSLAPGVNEVRCSS